MLVYHRASVGDGGPIVNQHWVHIDLKSAGSSLLAGYSRMAVIQILDNRTLDCTSFVISNLFAFLCAI